MKLLVEALLDMSVVNGKISASLIAKCLRFPNLGAKEEIETSRVDDLSMCIINNEGMRALYRVAHDRTPILWLLHPNLLNI